MDTPLSTQLNIIIPAFRGHTQNFLMVLEDISEKDALKRIEGRTNHIVWMAGNFVNMRYALAGVLGIPGKDPHEDIFFRAKALDESFSYPSLAELKENFHKISPILYQRLLTTTDEELKKPFPIGMNMSFFPESILNFVGMCIGREDYLCGQMGLMRRILNYPGMKYEVNENIKY